MTAYYNEINPYAAQWLRNLISAGHIAPGDVDERSIVDVRADELARYTQCHFFAGIGGWSLALRLTGWPDNRPVWTGSCPCQPFSRAGKREGAADDRHLWPHWFRLIREFAPAIIFGEQIALAIGDRWLDAVAHDLEGAGYAVGAAILPACAVGSPQIRDRLWFVADADGSEGRLQPGRRGGPERQNPPVLRNNGPAQSVANANDSDGHGRCSVLQMGWCGNEGEIEDDASPRRILWPSEPNVPRVAHGVSARVAKLCALGNAIVPQVAAAFIECAAVTSGNAQPSTDGATR